MSQQDEIRLEFPATYKYLRVVGECIRSMLELEEQTKDFEELIYNIQLAVHEVCNNIIEHAYRHCNGEIKMILAIEPTNSCFTVNIYDDGQPFDLDSVAEPDLDIPQVDGYGLFIARQLMDEVQYQLVGGQNHWYLSKAIPKK